MAMANVIYKEDKIDDLYERLQEETQKRVQMELQVTNITQKMTEIKNKFELLMERSERETQRTQQEMQRLLKSQFEQMMEFLQKGADFQVSSPVERTLKAEQDSPIKLEPEDAKISPNYSEEEEPLKISPFERFFMGVGNHFFNNPKDQLLFPKYKPKMKKNRSQHLKDYVWIPSTDLLIYYNENWLPLEAPNANPMNANIFCTKLKQIGSEMNLSPKDYSSLTLSRVRHIPIDWKYWHGRAQELGFDQNYTVNVNKLSKSVTGKGKRSLGQDSVETILNKNLYFG